MLTASSRFVIYALQNGGRRLLTPRQRRRIEKKARAQSPEAMDRRDTKIRQAMHVQYEQNRRRDVLYPAS